MDRDPPAGSLAELVRRYRMSAGLTQCELAYRAGISLRALRDLERGRIGSPRARSVRGLADALGLGPGARARLLSGSDAGAPRPAGRATPAPATARRDRPTLRIGVLGPLAVAVRGSGVDIRAPLERALLGLLALRHGGQVPYDEIVDVLWGESPPRSSRNLVQVYVRRLRTRLGEGSPGRGGGDRPLIRWGGGGYLLDAAPDEVDLVEFEGLLAAAAARRSGGDASGALDLVVEALAGWRGAVLADADSRLRHHPVAVAAAQRRLAAGMELGDLALAVGRPEPAVAALRVLVEAEPLHEGLHARLISALAAGGDRAAALHAYAQLRTRLAEELGVDPGPEAQAAYLRTLRAAGPAAGPPGAGTPAGEPAGGPPVPAQLPAAVADFTGRTRELAELDRLIARAGTAPGLPVVLITGTPGVGKTALAVHWAHRTAAEFPDGQLCADLLGYAPWEPLAPIVVLRRFIRALGVDPAAIPTEVDEAAATYRSLLARRRTLVLLDNAASAAQVRPLLPGSSTCAVLVTSRDRLTGLVGGAGAHRVDLGVLDRRDAQALLGRVIRPHAGRATAADLSELARRCAYLPLALRVAAANVVSDPRVTVAGYVAALAGSAPLSALVVDDDEELAVRAAFDLSYASLPPPVRRMFRLTSLAPGPDLGVPAAAALAGGTVEEAGRRLTALHDAHLMTGQPTGRYATHDLLRSYAGERAAGEEPEADRAEAARRLIDFYVETTYEAYPLLLPRRDDWPREVLHPPLEPLRFADRAAALAWHDQERQNLIGAVRMAADLGWHAAAWQLVDNLFAFFHLRRHWPDWIGAGLVGLDGARRLGDRRAAARMHNALGVAHKQLGRHDEAAGHYQRALELAEEVGYTRFVAAMRVNLGGLCIARGDPAAGARHLRAALADPQYGDDPQYATITYLNLGCALLDLERHAEAAAALDRALGSATAVRDAQNACHAHHNLAEIALRRGDLATARRHAERAAELAAEVGDPLRLAAAVDMTASCAAPADLARARGLWREAHRIYARLGHPVAPVLAQWLRDLDTLPDADLPARDRDRRRRLRGLL